MPSEEEKVSSLKRNDYSMQSAGHMTRTMKQNRIRWWSLLLFLCFLGTAGVNATGEWQVVEERSWVSAEMPSGWSSSIESNETASPDTIKIVSLSPGHDARLTCLAEHTPDIMSGYEIPQFQSSYMSKLGFRICKTKDPVIEESEGRLAYRQTYVRGTDDAAVIGTITYRDWGQMHFILVMEGPQAVAEYYESIPTQVQDHIIPVFLKDE